jgi:molybdate transport system substrate-binding protein
MKQAHPVPSWAHAWQFLAATAAILVLAAAGDSPLAARSRDVLIFAAASMQTALDEIAPALEKATDLHPKFSYAASSTLAKQIERGAPAEIFISADLDWMDYVETRNLIKKDSRVNFVGNTLVLIAPARQPVSLKIAPGFPLASRLGSSRLAVADPASVPAGKYAKAALTALGVWDSVSSKLAPAENVRAALVLVERGESPLGIVYRTDAVADSGVIVVDTFPASTHPPIVYPVALTSTATPNASRVLEYLDGSAARAVFARQGFLTDVK